MLCSLVNWATEISTASSMHEIKKACVRGRLRSMGGTGRTEERLLASAAGRPISRWGQFSGVSSVTRPHMRCLPLMRHRMAHGRTKQGCPSDQEDCSYWSPIDGSPAEWSHDLRSISHYCHRSLCFSFPFWSQFFSHHPLELDRV